MLDSPAVSTLIGVNL